jgi:hypothetical protein
MTNEKQAPIFERDLVVARQKRDFQVRTLELRVEDANKSLQGFPRLTGVARIDDDLLKQAENRRQAVRELEAQIAEQRNLSDPELIARYNPPPDPELVKLLESGFRFTDTLARGRSGIHTP